MNIQIYRNLQKLFEKFSSCKNVSPDEFIQEILLSSDHAKITNDEIEKFVLLVRHKKFLEVIKSNFVSHHNLKNYSDVKIIMVVFLIIFASEGATAEDLFNIFKEIKCAFKQKLLRYFCDENNLITTALTGLKFFEDEYVLKYMINPVLGKTEIFIKVCELLADDKAKKYMKKPPTVPDHLNLLQWKKAVPTVPLNTPTKFPFFQAREIPKSLYMADPIERRLIGEFEKNKLKAQKLLAEAKGLCRNYCKSKKSVIPTEITPPHFKANKVPLVKQNVGFKANIATILKEANLCIKEQETEIKNIEEILKGGFTLEKFKKLEESARRERQEQLLEQIERKHLLGQLTFEEAILARKKLVDENKEKFKHFMEEREHLLRKIEQWRQEESEKMKMLVKKGQDIERNAKESEKKLKEEKRNQVNQFKHETEKLLQDAYEKQKEDLAKKIKLIEEIKTLHQVKSVQVKEFDRSDCPDLGLLCQMSIAELQENLALMKIEMVKEIERKRRCILKYKEQQKQMIENVKNFITQARMSKPKQESMPNQTAKLARSPDLDRLKSELARIKSLRKSKA